MPARRTIGLLVNYTWGRFFELVLSGIQTVTRRHGMDVIAIAMTPADVARTHIAQKRVDGWLALSFATGLEQLAQQGKPIVTICTQTPGLALPAVLPNNQQGIAAVMEHLFAHGHTQIAFIGNTPIGDIQERYES
jgi:LacI family transcriptional regulator